MNFIWHLGFQKTGTTFIQQVLDRNAAKIQDSVFLANKGELTKGIRRRGVGFCELRNPNAERRLRTELEILREKAVKSQMKTALFSDEVLLGHHVISERNNFVEAAFRILPIIEATMAPHNCTFVFYVRDFAPWLQSAYNQGVKVLRYKASFVEWLALYKGTREWNCIQEHLQSAVSSPVQFIDVAEDMSPFLGAQLLTIAGLDTDVLSDFNLPGRMNESLPDGALEFLRLLNGTEIEEAVLALVRRKIRNNPQFFAKN